jgi:hypothetical protein
MTGFVPACKDDGSQQMTAQCAGATAAFSLLDNVAEYPLPTCKRMIEQTSIAPAPAPIVSWLLCRDRLAPTKSRKEATADLNALSP